METQIAEAHWTPIENRDRDRTYNEYTIAAPGRRRAGLRLGRLFRRRRLGDVPRLIVRQNTALPKIAAIYAETPVDDAAGLAGLPHHRRAPRRACPSASRTPSGSSARATCRASRNSARRDKRGISFAEGMLGEAVGRQYVAEYFPAESKAKMEELVANLRVALGHRIDNLELDERRDQGRRRRRSWTSSPSRSAIPTKWRDYSELEIRRRRPVRQRRARRRNSSWNYELARLNEPVDKTEWGMTPQTVNAYYNSDQQRDRLPGRASCSRPSSIRTRTRP